MIEQLPRSHDNVLGFTVSGDITKDDYAVLDPAVAAAVKDSGTVRLLLDLTDFHWEKASAWGADLHFGSEFHKAMECMAIVGDKKWEQWLAKLAQPFYAQEAKYFDSIDEAWAWLES